MRVRESIMPNKYKCRQCVKTIQNNNPGSCRQCRHYFHVECIEQGIVYDADKGDLLCPSCLKAELIEVTKSKNVLQKKYDKAIADLDKAITDLTLMQDRVKALEEKIEVRQNLSENDLVLIKEKIKSELIKEQDNHIKEMINEQRLQNEKRLNLCVSGLQAVDNKSDISLLKDLFISQLGLNTREVEKMTNCKRFATKNNKSIIIVTFDCKEVRRNILRKAIKLKNYRTSDNTSVFISPDMTKMQQKESYELRKALKTQRENGFDVIIRNNQIVSRNPTVADTEPTRRMTRSHANIVSQPDPQPLPTPPPTETNHPS